MPKIYTKTGDAGETSLFDGSRVLKSHPRMEVLGDLDELNAAIGLCDFPLRDSIQSTLLYVGAIVGGGQASFDPTAVCKLEEEIDRLAAELSPLTNFILPRGIMHLARAICRRAERHLLLIDTDAEILKFMNRLSDYLFMAARVDHPDVIWSAK